MGTEFNRHPELFESNKCDEFEKRYFTKVAYGEATESELTQALLFLSRMLAKHHGKKTFIMIDEYDTPIQQGYMRGYYDVSEKYEEICERYDGYRFGQTDIFNPWSVIGYFDNH